MATKNKRGSIDANIIFIIIAVVMVLFILLKFFKVI